MLNIDDWFAKYYPTPADEAAQGTDLEAINHCLLKWQGAADAEEYGLTYESWYLADNNGNRVFWFDIESCALCEKYPEEECHDSDGRLCPFCRHTGHMCPYVESKYAAAPMITALQQIKLAEQNQAQ